MHLVDIIKPKLDTREYKFLKLENELEILLVSDSESQTSAAAMDVKVGHFSDPADFPGLAHFCEHMCFLGSSKYPQEGEYQDFIKKNGGSTNAGTSTETTGFYFSVQSGQLEKALDMFAQFFISPSFTESATGREILAVDSEHKKNLNEDHWRQYQILKSNSNPQHPFSKFATGNVETLDTVPKERNQNVRDALMEFHAKYYSSNQMKLCILGQQPISQLEEWAISKFSEIKNKGSQTHHFYPPSDVKPFHEEQLSKFIRTKTISDITELLILFPVSTQSDHIDGRNMIYKYKPDKYISHLIGHEGKGSLCSYLKKLGWISALSAGPFVRIGGVYQQVDTFTSCTLYTVTIELTTEGELHTKEIVEKLFEFIDLISSRPVERWVFDEISHLAEIGLQNLEFPSAMQCASDLSQNLTKYLPRDVFAGAHLIEFNEVAIVDFLKQLNAHNFNMYYQKNTFDDTNFMEEKWYGSKYSVEDIEKEWIEQLSNVKHLTPQLDFPPKNPFIPEDLSIKGVIDQTDNNQPPILLVANNNNNNGSGNPNVKVKTWFKQDNYFGTPRGSLIYNIIIPQTKADPRTIIQAELFAELVMDYMNEEAYMAEVAGIQYTISFNPNGMNVIVIGFNDKLLQVNNKVLQTMVDCADKKLLTEQRFNVILELLARNHTNFPFAQPYEHTMIESVRFMYQRKFCALDYIPIIGSITYEGFYNFVQMWMRTLRVELLIHGNFTSEEADTISKETENILFNNRSSNGGGSTSSISVPLPCQENREYVVQLPTGSDLLVPVLSYNPTNPNHAVEIVYQLGLRNSELESVAELFNQIVSTPYYSCLRTEKQLGYIVHTRVRFDHNTCSFSCILQSPSYDPKQILTESDTFMESFGEVLTAISEEDLQEIINSLVSRILEKEKKMKIESARLMTEISNQQYKFDRRIRKVEALKKITKQHLIDLYNDYLLPSGSKFKRASFLLYASSDPKSYENAATFKDERKSVLVTDRFNFKHTLPLYPTLSDY